ncbi:FAD-dependent oxidoreductase [Candidatus Bathyarchaeota archaeon]|nr:MAG: FAD-dependent oxidoreductase [Candidatus Bathyarchaeota archaeon]
MRDVYDVAIIGMGAVGTATGFLLAEFTNLQSLLFLEKENSAGQIASNRRTNSQTRHPFGGELNYSPEVMKAIKRYSDMIPSYANSEYGREYDILRRTKSGMVLAVGRNERDYLRKKFHDTVKPVFPYAELMEDKEEIAKLEPYIVRGRKRDEEIGIIRLQADMVDFGELATSFQDNASKRQDKKINVKFNTKVKRIENVSEGYDVHTDNAGSFSARYLVVSAGSYTLSFAKQLGLGADFVAFPVAGKFYTSPSIINGKVYTFQEEGVPFAATHADREWDGAVTRYGPTATPTLMFEKDKPDIKEFIDNLDSVLLDTVISKKAIRNIMIKNIAYSLPGVGRHLFWKYEARKIVPSIPYADLKPAPEFGGVRTVGINKRTRELRLGEFTLPEVPKNGVNICANMAPSPGASGCLGIAYKNVHKIASALDLHFDDEKFTKVFGTIPIE